MDTLDLVTQENTEKSVKKQDVTKQYQTVSWMVLKRPNIQDPSGKYNLKLGTYISNKIKYKLWAYPRVDAHKGSYINVNPANLGPRYLG